MVDDELQNISENLHEQQTPGGKFAVLLEVLIAKTKFSAHAYFKIINHFGFFV